MKDLDYTILINKNNPLPKTYQPKNLITTDNNENNFHKYKNPNLKPMIRADLIPYINAMFLSAKAEGLELIVDSGYRSYSYQQLILDELVKEKGSDAYQLAALPGTSEHQTGLAFDVACFRNKEYSDNINGDDKESIWLSQNSYKFGFILRYPKGKENITGYQYEPWHFRFVGLELAKILYDNNLTLEEYYQNKRKIKKQSNTL